MVLIHSKDHFFCLTYININKQWKYSLNDHCRNQINSLDLCLFTCFIEIATEKLLNFLSIIGRFS